MDSKYNGKYIKLFNKKLLFHERSMGDALELNEFVESLDSVDISTDCYIKTVAVLDGLKLNLDQGNENEGLDELITAENMYRSCSIRQLNELYDVLVYDLEKAARTKERDTKEKISSSVAIGLISRYFSMSWDDVKNLSVSQYVLRLEQAFNFMKYDKTGSFDLLNHIDKQVELEDEYEQIKSRL
jgi:hypothetical protein